MNYKYHIKFYIKYILLISATILSQFTNADELKQDGIWRGNVGAGLSISSGNSNSESLNISTNAARATNSDKIAVYGQILGGRSQTNGIYSTTANQWSAGTRYDYNFSQDVFGFGGLDLNHDQLKLLSLRTVVSAGLGYHVIRTKENQFDLYGGAAYRNDQYSGLGLLINNEMVTSFNTPQLLIGEESNHKLTETTTFQQKLNISPNLNNSHGYLVTFNTGLQVSMSKTISLNITAQDRYDSLSQPPLKKNDLMFFTGVNLMFGK